MMLNADAYEGVDKDFNFAVVPLAGPDKVDFQILIKNNANVPLEFEFSNSQLYEIIVKNKAGKEVYAYSKGRMFLQAIQKITIEPNQVYKRNETWDYKLDGVKLPAGEYIVTAELKVKKVNGQPVGSPQMLTSSKKLAIPDSSTGFRNIEVSGEKGTYSITGEVKGDDRAVFYTVEDGHNQYLAEQRVLINKIKLTEWQRFSFTIQVSPEKLPKNGTLIVYLYQRSSQGENENTLPVVLERF